MKILYFDTETTGLNPNWNGMIQLACIVEIDGEVVEEKNWNIRPFKGDKIDEYAMKINGKTEGELLEYPEPERIYGEIQEFFCRHIDKYSKTDKFYPAGYNIKFDLDFLAAFFRKNNDKYFASFFKSTPIDPMYYLGILEIKGKIALQDYKLATVCDHFGIKIDAHDALSDVKATRELIHELVFRKL